MKTSVHDEQFLCPECGSEEAEQANPGGLRRARDGMRRGYVCTQCGFEVPAHLAERWGGISLEDARKEWREIYRFFAKRKKGPNYEPKHSNQAVPN